MSNKNRVYELEQNVKYWQKAQIAVEEIRDRLIDDQLNGFTLLDDNGNDVLPDRVRAVDKTVLYHQRCLFLLRTLLKRAKVADSPVQPVRRIKAKVADSPVQPVRKINGNHPKSSR